MLKIVNFIIKKIGVKFNNFKLKKFVDSGFIIVEIILVKLSRLHNLYLDFYEDMVEKEIKLANISNNDKILHIGCGPIPATSIILTKKTNASITAIDRNPKYVDLAKKCVEKQQKSDKINILLSDATNFAYKTYDLIILSQGIKKCREILKIISRNIKKETSIIYRTSTDNQGNLSEKDYFIKDFFNIEKISYHKKNGLLVSIHLKKKLINKNNYWR